MSPSKNKPEKQPQPAQNPGVRAKDHVYFQHGADVRHGRVLACGADGATVDCDGSTHRVTWDRVLGHKQRAKVAVRVVDQGEDGAIVEDERGRRQFLRNNDAGGEPEKEIDDMQKSGNPGVKMALLVKARRAAHIEPEKRPAKKATPEGPDGFPHPHGAPVRFKAGTVKGRGKIVARGRDGATVEDSAKRRHQLHWHELEKDEGGTSEEKDSDGDKPRPAFLAKAMPVIIVAKSHIAAYTKKDGTFVAAHEDKRQAEQSGRDLPQGATVFKGRRPNETWQDPERHHVKDASGKIIGSGYTVDQAVDAAHSRLRTEEVKAQAEKAAKKSPKGTASEETVRLYHSSPSEKIEKIHAYDNSEENGIFGGLFASSGPDGAVGLAPGETFLHHIDVPESKIATRREMKNLAGRRLAAANRVIRDMVAAHAGKVSRADLVLLQDAVLEERGVFSHSLEPSQSDRLAELVGFSSDPGRADWQIQAMRGQVAAALGYQAVEMTDEHGVSYLVLPGAEVKRVKEG